MILRTLLAGQPVPGSVEKSIVHPYTGAAPDALEYARDIPISPFIDMGTRNFRQDLYMTAHLISQYLEKNKSAITIVAAHETGSPIHYQEEDLENARTFLEKLSYLETLQQRKYLLSDPKGNILLILPANEPILTAVVLIFSALFTGNIVFVKPSSKAPTFASMLIKELSTISLLRERIHFLVIDGPECERLVRNRAFDFVLSLGSRSTNKTLGITCAEAEVEFLYESEGNDWAYIDKCISQQQISRLIVDSFTKHNGQMCNALRGLIVHSSIYDPLVDLLKECIVRLPVDSPMLPITRIGALIAGTETHASSLVSEAASHSKGVWNFTINKNVITPTLIFEPNIASRICHESVFAPVLWIKKVGDHSEAISLFKEVNVHGLSFSVFSKNEEVVADCIRSVKVGRINVNKHPLEIGLFEPMGGIGLSGRGGPMLWIEKMSNTKFVNN